MRHSGRLVPPPPPPPHAPLDASQWQRPPPHPSAYPRDDAYSPDHGRVYVSPRRSTPEASYRERSDSPHTLGDEERAALSSVVARLKRGLDGGEEVAVQDPVARAAAPAPAPEPTPRGGDLRGQLDRAGVVIAQQLETSARKDVLLTEQEARCHLEKLQYAMQLEHLHDVLAQDRMDRSAIEDALSHRIRSAEQGAVEEEELRAAINGYEQQLGDQAKECADNLQQMTAKCDELRREMREALQTAADQQEEALAAAEARHRADKDMADETAELLLMQIQELEERLALFTQEDISLLDAMPLLQAIADESAEREQQHAEETDALRRELEEAHAAHERLVEELKEEHERELGQEKEDRALELEQLEERHAAEMQRLQEQSEELVRDQAEQSDAERQQLQEQHDQELQDCQRTAEELQTALDEARAEAAQAQADHEEAAARLQEEAAADADARIAALTSEFEAKTDALVQEHEAERGAIEGPLRGGMSDLLRLCSRGGVHLVHELVLLQQEAGRLTILLQEQQEVLQFFLSRYAPHHLDFEQGGEAPEVPPGTKHISPYPSYWGWVHRSSGMFVTWQRRFCVLRDGVLRFGTSDGGPFQTLFHCEALARVEVDSYGDAAQVSHPPTGKYESFGFLVETYSRQKFRFCCTSSSERSEWMAVLRKHIEIRLDRERHRAFDASSPDRPEPFLYLEDCSPPEPPPTYRTRIRLADSGAYPLMGPGSPRRSDVPPPLCFYDPAPPSPRPSARVETSPRFGDPPRPPMVTPPRSRGAQQQQPRSSGRGRAHGHASSVGPIRAGPGQQGGASGVGLARDRGQGRRHSGGGTALRRGSRSGSGAATPGSGGRRPDAQHSSTPGKPAPPPTAADLVPVPADSSIGDPFLEGTVPVDVLLIRLESDEVPQALQRTQVVAASFRSQCQATYEQCQVLYGGGGDDVRRCERAAATIAETLGSPAPTGLRVAGSADAPAVVQFLNNIATRPAVPGAPASQLLVLVAPREAVDPLAELLGGGFSGSDGAMYSSLCAPHRGSVTWSLVTQLP